jgi:hypothetical protein
MGNWAAFVDRGEWPAAAQNVPAPILTSTVCLDRQGATACSRSKGAGVREGGSHAVDDCGDSVGAVGARHG